MADTPTFETVNFELHDAVALIELNRPEKLNAVNQQMQRDLAGAIKAVSRERAIRAVVLTGAGRGFCVGQDLTDFGRHDEDFRVDDYVRTTWNRVAMGLRELDRPVIAAINGVAAGAGASLALAADLRFAADNASLMQAFIRIGLVPDTGSTWFLAQLVGVSRAMELTWTGRSVGAEEALGMGMVDRVVPADRLREETIAFASELAAMPTRAIGMTKKAIYRAATSTLAEALEYEAQLQHAATQTEDHSEGVMAFLEKRDPAFTGR